MDKTLRWYTIKVGPQYVSWAAIEGGDGVTFTNKREAAEEYLHFAAVRVVQGLLRKGASPILIEEVE